MMVTCSDGESRVGSCTDGENKSRKKSGPGGSNPGPCNCHEGELPTEQVGPFVIYVLPQINI